MKRLLLVAISMLFIMTATAADPDLNPYAYNLSSSYNPSTLTLTVNYSLNAPAKSVAIVAVDSQGNTYTLCRCGARTANDHTENIQLLHSDDIDKLPRNEQLSWRIDVKGETYTTHQICGRKINGYTPFSIAIDKNPNSKYFGRIITTQANNNPNANYGKSVGLYAYDASFRGGYHCIDTDVNLGNNQNWYDDTFLTPYRVRIVQDGSGRVLVSSAAVGQPTYLWWVNPDNLNDWRELIQSHTMKEYAPVGLKNKESDSMGNIDFDLQEDGDKLNIMLFGSSITTGDQTLTGDALHSGIYTCNLSDLSGGTYRALTEDNRLGGKPHPQVTNSNYLSFLNGHTLFDQFGGVWYCGYGVQSNQFPEEPALVHFIDGDASLALQYEDNNYIKRKSVGSASICYNRHFNRFAISQGNLKEEARIYDISQTDGEHPKLYNGLSVDAINPKIDSAKYVVDMCWDYADNLYLCVRNRSKNLWGVWVVAAALNGEATSTPAPINKGYEFTMGCDGTYAVTAKPNNTAYGTVVNAADGTPFVSGNYQACTELTLKAVYKDGYEFEKWIDQSGKEYTTPTIEVLVSKELTLTAYFKAGVYDVEWYNLFKNGEDIVDPNTDTERNSRLWRFFQVEYNNYAKTKPRQSDMGEATNTQSGANRYMYYVLKFVNTNFGKYDDKSKNELRALIESFLDSEQSSFYWLGQYLESVVNKDIHEKEYVNVWGFYLQSFINRTVSSHNVDFTAATSVGTTLIGDYKIVDFSAAGHPDQWRPYWTEKVCGLPRTMKYGQAMPIDWNKNYTPPTDSIIKVGNSNYKPSDWFQWNKAPSSNTKNYIRVWRKNSLSGEIVNCVNEDMKLYADYVLKDIDENRDYIDVMRVMLNEKYGNNNHHLLVSRKLTTGMYNTICLPFDVKLDTLSGVLKDATAMKFTGVESLYNESGDPVTVLKFTPVNIMEAGKPYLIKLADTQSDITESIQFYKVPISSLRQSVDTTYSGDIVLAAKGPDTYGGISFHPVLKPIELQGGELLLVANNRLAINANTDNAANNTMKGLRGYFTIDPSAIDVDELQAQAKSGRIYLSISKPTTTSIPVAPEAEQQVKPEVRKVMYDGKIYILRGEEVYTITGHRVR